MSFSPDQNKCAPATLQCIRFVPTFRMKKFARRFKAQNSLCGGRKITRIRVTPAVTLHTSSEISRYSESRNAEIAKGLRTCSDRLPQICQKHQVRSYNRLSRDSFVARKRYNVGARAAVFRLLIDTTREIRGGERI